MQTTTVVKRSTAFRFGAVLAVLLTALVTACSPAQSGPDTTDGPTGTVRNMALPPAGRPDIEPPEPGPDFFVEGRDGALATAQYFMAGFAYGLSTGDGSVVLQSSTPDCSGCWFFVTTIASVDGEGGWSNAVDIDLANTEVSITTVDGELAFVVEATVIEGPRTYTYEDGTTEHVAANSDMRMQFLVTFDGTHGTVYQVTQA